MAITQRTGSDENGKGNGSSKKSLGTKRIRVSSQSMRSDGEKKESSDSESDSSSDSSQSKAQTKSKRNSQEITLYINSVSVGNPPDDNKRRLREIVAMLIRASMVHGSETLNSQKEAA